MTNTLFEPGPTHEQYADDDIRSIYPELHIAANGEPMDHYPDTVSDNPGDPSEQAHKPEDENQRREKSIQQIEEESIREAEQPADDELEMNAALLAMGRDLGGDLGRDLGRMGFQGLKKRIAADAARRDEVNRLRRRAITSQNPVKPLNHVRPLTSLSGPGGIHPKRPPKTRQSHKRPPTT